MMKGPAKIGFQENNYRKMLIVTSFCLYTVVDDAIRFVSGSRYGSFTALVRQKYIQV
jgi:hypothetical protein